jgi:uncharacterized iron-regulated protein
MLPRMQRKTPGTIPIRQAIRLLARCLLPVVCLALVAGCGGFAPQQMPVARVSIFGEQHDQPDQQLQVAQALSALASKHQLAAVVLEMAEQGHDTRSLSRLAEPAAVRSALAWSGWPWDDYAEIVMGAVRAGVPVFGGNLPRAAQTTAMGSEDLDVLVPVSARDRILGAVRDGHCGLLPASAETGMVRIQIARDRALAETTGRLAGSAAAGQSVLLLVGAQHAARDRGVPLHLAGSPGLAPQDVRVVLFGDDQELPSDERRPARFTPRPDPCQGLRNRWAPAGRTETAPFTL